MIALLAVLICSSAPGTGSVLLGRLAKAYDYQGLRNVRVDATTGSFQFRPGTSLDLEVASAYELFPEDTAHYKISESQFTRKVMRDSKTDVGNVPGLVDFASLFNPATATVQIDSAHAGFARVFLPDIHNAWFSIGHVPVIPFMEVQAVVLVDVRSLEIAEIRADVHTPGGVPDHETYVVSLGQYRTVQGRLIPGSIRYSLPGLSTGMNDRSMEFVQGKSMSNRAYRDSMVNKVRALERSGQKDKAARFKRASVRVRSLKAQIADAFVSTGKPFEVKVLAVNQPTAKPGKKK